VRTGDRPLHQRLRGQRPRHRHDFVPTGVQTCALPILPSQTGAGEHHQDDDDHVEDEQLSRQAPPRAHPAEPVRDVSSVHGRPALRNERIGPAANPAGEPNSPSVSAQNRNRPATRTAAGPTPPTGSRERAPLERLTARWTALLAALGAPAIPPRCENPRLPTNVPIVITQRDQPD